MAELATYECTQAEAEDLEYAWRAKAAAAGWRIYGKPPYMEVDPYKRLTLRRRLIAWRLRWPREHRRGWRVWPWAAAGAGGLLLARIGGIA